MRTIILFSGGLDSLATAMHFAQAEGPKPDLVFVTTGTRYEQAEIQACIVLARALAMPLHIVPLPLVAFEGPGSYIPFRNLFLAAAAVGWAEKKYGIMDTEVWMGGLRDDHISDKTPEAFDVMGYALSKIGRCKVTINSLWWDHAKVQMVAAMMRRFPDTFVPLAENSLSCYQGTNCGNCASCVRKYVSLTANGIECADWFKTDPSCSDEAVAMLKRVQDGSYDAARVAATLRVLQGGL